MTQTLYRKYRPQTFAEVVGQEHITRTLLNQVKTGQIAHAYLFSGPRGIGKTTTARLLAKAANAHHKKTGEPDNEAPINQAISQGRSLDLVEIDAASNRKIEEVRELREHVKYPPNEAKYKVFIIDEVHMLTTEAFNALLKTLEEPPEYVIFILATTELSKLPDTIISRCQRFDFKKVTPQILESRLRYLSQAEGVVVAPAVFKTIVKLSEGCVRDAESILGQVLSLGGKNITEQEAEIFLPKSNVLWLDKFWNVLLQGDSKSGLEIIQQMIANDIEIEYFYDDWLELLRHILIWKINPDSTDSIYIVTEEVSASIKKSLKKFTVEQLRMITDVFIKHKDYFGVVPLPQMVLELALITVISRLDKKDSDNNNSKDDKSDQVIEENKNSAEQSELKHDKNFYLTWEKVIQKLSEHTPNLAHYLKSVAMTKTGSTLELIVGHSFHYEIIKKPSHLDKIKIVLQDFTQEKLNIKVRLDEQFKLPEKSDNILNDLAQTFGGRVVDEILDE